MSKFKTYLSARNQHYTIIAWERKGLIHVLSSFVCRLSGEYLWCFKQTKHVSNKTAIQVIDTIYSEVQNGCSAEINILSQSEDSSAKIGDWKVVISWFVGLIHIKGLLR